MHGLEDRHAIADVGAGDHAQAADQARTDVGQDVAVEVLEEHHVEGVGVLGEAHADVVEAGLFLLNEGVVLANLEEGVDKGAVGERQHALLVHDGDLAATGVAGVLEGPLGDALGGVAGADLQADDGVGVDVVLDSRVQPLGVLAEDH